MKRNITQRTRDGYLTPEEAAKYLAIREQLDKEMPEIVERHKRRRELEQANSNAGLPIAAHPACIAAERQASKDYPGCDEFKGGIVHEAPGQIVVEVACGKHGFDLFPIPIARYVIDPLVMTARQVSRDLPANRPDGTIR
jgi:hypothetical protein